MSNSQTDKYNRFDKLYYEKFETKIFMPNEIFDDLMTVLPNNPKARALIYCYYFFVSWLFRYCKYVQYRIQNIIFTQKEIKKFLGFSPDNKKTDKFIGHKEDSVINQMGYTESSTDFPVCYFYDKVFDGFCFAFSSEYPDLKDFYSMGNFHVKYPLKGLYNRVFKNLDYELYGDFDYELEGAFYDVSFTHELNIEEFTVSMDNPEIGVMGFYIFGWLKFQLGIHKVKSFEKGMIPFSKEIGISENTLRKYLHALQRNGFINIVEQKERYLKHNQKKGNIFSVNIITKSF